MNARHPVRLAVAASLALCCLGSQLVSAESCSIAASKAADHSAIQQRIDRIQHSVASGKTLAERMNELHVPGISVAMIHDGKIEWACGFGVVKSGGAPITPNTIFQAASISKPVAAMAALRLVQTGKLSLDTDVNTYLKSWKIPQNTYTQENKVTLRGLLSHTAGMSVHGFDGYRSDEPVPSVVQILNGEKPANNPPIRVESTPGKAWSYSGGGYTVVQQLLEDVTGKPFPKILHDLVLQPLDMKRSAYEQPLAAAHAADAAMAHDEQGNPVAGGPHTMPELAAAGLWTTPSDLARYAIEIQKTLAGKSSRVLSQSMTLQMLQPILGDFGLGLHLGGPAEHRYFEHTGSNVGYRNRLFAFESGDGVVLMTNSDSGRELTQDLVNSIAQEYGWPDRPH